MRQAYVALTAGIVFGAIVALQPGDGIHSAYAAKNACNKNCKTFFKDCKTAAKGNTSAILGSLSDAKKACNALSDKDAKKTCRGSVKDQKRAAKQFKKEALKSCKAYKKCRLTECKELAAGGDDSCIFASPMESFGECITSLL